MIVWHLRGSRRSRGIVHRRSICDAIRIGRIGRIIVIRWGRVGRVVAGGVRRTVIISAVRSRAGGEAAQQEARPGANGGAFARETVMAAAAGNAANEGPPKSAVPGLGAEQLCLRSKE